MTICALNFAFLGLPSFANEVPRYALGLGTLLTNMGAVSTQADQTAALFQEAHLQLQAAGRFVMGELFFVPMITYTPLLSTDVDESTSKHFLSVSTGIEKYWDRISANFGPGVLIQTLDGTGGSTKLNNGTSTSTFYHPSSSTSTRTFFLQAGVGYSLNPYRMDLFEWIGGPFGNRRTFNTVFSFSYGFI